MRLMTLFWLGLAAALIGALFFIKYEVQDLERELARIKRETRNEREAIHILKAEWSYLNRPARLRALINDRLDLVPVERNQIKEWELLPARLEMPPVAEPPTRRAPPGKRGNKRTRR